MKRIRNNKDYDVEADKFLKLQKLEPSTAATHLKLSCKTLPGSATTNRERLNDYENPRNTYTRYYFKWLPAACSWPIFFRCDESKYEDDCGLVVGLCGHHGSQQSGPELPRSVPYLTSKVKTEGNQKKSPDC